MFASLYTHPLRSTARRLGITRLVTLPHVGRRWWRLREYERRRPAAIEVQVEEQRAKLLTDDAYEYCRVCSYRDDRHILEALLQRVLPGDVYWDIGASIGLYACVLADAVGPTGQVVAFEPEARSHAKLLRNVALNELKNVNVQAVALGDASSRGVLQVSENTSSGTHSMYAPSNGASVQEIEVTTGDALRAALGLRVPTVLKVDVEGGEEEVIRGLEHTLESPECRSLLCEVHFALLEARGRGDAPSRIQSWLGDRGFKKLTWLDASHLMADK